MNCKFVLLYGVLAATFSIIAKAAPTSSENPSPAPNGKVLSFTSGAVLEKGVMVLRATGGTGSLTYSLQESGGGAAKLPEGMEFLPSGEVAGRIPEVESVKNYNYLLEVRDGGGGKASKPLSLQINPAIKAVANDIKMTAGGRIVQPVFPVQIRSGTGTGSVSYNLVNAAGGGFKLPSGMQMDASGGITGKVPESQDAFEGLQIRLQDQGGGQLTVPAKFSLYPPLKLLTQNVLLTAGGSLERPLAVVQVDGGSGSVRYMLLEDSGTLPAKLPDGLSFDPQLGTVSGKLLSSTLASEKKYLLKAVDTAGGEAEGRVLVKINPPLQVALD